MKKYLENFVYAIVVALVLAALLAQAVYHQTVDAEVVRYLVASLGGLLLAALAGAYYHRKNLWTWEGYLLGLLGASIGAFTGGAVAFLL